MMIHVVGGVDLAWEWQSQSGSDGLMLLSRYCT